MNLYTIYLKMFKCDGHPLVVWHTDGPNAVRIVSVIVWVIDGGDGSTGCRDKTTTGEVWYKFLQSYLFG